ncbi:nucleoside monophosphate kinase [Candidatus Latescibacterota bacterium]
MSERPEALLLLGPTGAGKTPLGDALEASGLSGRRCLHFDFGANLRGVAEDGCLPSTGRPPGRLSTDDLRTIEESLRTGALLENESFHIARDLLLSFADQRGLAVADLLILNGLPRHAGQARDLDAYLEVARLCLLECTAAVVAERLTRDTGGDRAERIDDGMDLVSRKLAIFSERTMPLVAHYEALGARVDRIPVDVDSTAGHLIAQL